MIRSPAPSTRFSDCVVPSSARSSAIGLRARRFAICAPSLSEAINAVARRDDHLARGGKGEADQTGATDDERPAFGVETVDARGSGERLDDMQIARAVECEALRPPKRLADRFDAAIERHPVNRI